MKSTDRPWNGTQLLPIDHSDPVHSVTQSPEPPRQAGTFCRLLERDFVRAEVRIINWPLLCVLPSTCICTCIYNGFAMLRHVINWQIYYYYYYYAGWLIIGHAR